MIKMIATDMDGTLLGRNGLSQRSVQAIRMAKEAGIEFVIATGRDLSGVSGIFDEYKLSFSAVLGNGAQYINREGKILKTAYLNKAYFKDIIQIFEDLQIHFMIFADDGFYSIQEPEDVCEAFIIRGMHRFSKTRQEVLAGWSRSSMPCMNLKKIRDVDQFLKEDHQIIKVEAFDIDTSKIAEAKKLLKEIHGIAYLSSFVDNVEVTDKNAQKGLILRSVIDELNIKPEEVAVFGDGLNDLTLFQQFPYSFAVANADPEIKSLAYKIIPSNEQDGVAQTIEAIIKRQSSL